MARKKTAVYPDEDLLTATKVLAATMGRPEYEVVEEALQLSLRQARARHAWRQLDAFLEALAERSTLPDEESMALATAAVHEARSGKRPAAPPSDPEASRDGTAGGPR